MIPFFGQCDLEGEASHTTRLVYLRFSPNHSQITIIFLLWDASPIVPSFMRPPTSSLYLSNFRICAVKVNTFSNHSHPSVSVGN